MGFEKEFQLNAEELNLLLNIEAHITQLDIELTDDPDAVVLKMLWFDEWKGAINNDVAGQGYGTRIVDDIKPLIAELTKLRNEQPHKLNILFFEATIFRPYFNLNDRKLKGLKRLECKEEHLQSVLQSLSLQVGVDYKGIKRTIEIYEEAIRGIRGRSSIFESARNSKIALSLLAAVAIGVTGGVLAPFIGGIIGSLMGLSGAAAVSAGLALLGGGALAAGGLGMAGGTFVLIGGGAALGGASAFIFSSNLIKQNKIVLSQLAKLEACIKGLFGNELDLEKQKSILNNFREAINQLNNTVEQLKSEISKAEERLNNAEEQQKEVIKKNISQLEENRSTFEVTLRYYENARLRLKSFFLD